MSVFWSHRQLPELAAYENKQKDLYWNQCTEKYGIGKSKYVCIGFLLPAALLLIIYFITFMYAFPFIHGGFYRTIVVGALGGILGFLSSALRVYILRPYLQQMLATQSEKAEQGAAANP